MAARMLTASSHGRVAALLLSAGCAYTYVSSGVNPYDGSLIGWASRGHEAVITINCNAPGAPVHSDARPRE
jgi:hypothetical protein